MRVENENRAAAGGCGVLESAAYSSIYKPLRSCTKPHKAVSRRAGAVVDMGWILYFNSGRGLLYEYFLTMECIGYLF